MLSLPSRVRGSSANTCRRGQRPDPGQGHTHRKAADLGQLLIATCELCRRSVAFLATDVLPVWDADSEARYTRKSSGEIVAISTKESPSDPLVDLASPISVVSVGRLQP